MWFYAGHKGFVPSAEEAAGKIVRVNSGHDSNIQKSLVLFSTRHFPHRFYNTSIPNLEFENAPVVLTVNRDEDKCWTATEEKDNLMYVRARVNTWNLELVREIIDFYTKRGIPVVLTFMRYYDVEQIRVTRRTHYEWRHHVLHDYWDITPEAWWQCMQELARHDLVFSCGTPLNHYCRDCGVCETLYWRLLAIEGRTEEIQEGIGNG